MKHAQHLAALAVTSALLSTTGAVQAGTVVSSGSVTRELGSRVFVDTASGREWLGADVTKYFSYTQTLAQMGQGGLFEGYAMASYADVAQLVLDFALPNTGSCQSQDYGWGYAYNNCQGQTSTSGTQVFGQSYLHGGWYSDYGYNYNYGWFLSEASSADSMPAAGILQVYSYGGDANYISAEKSWGTTQETDYYAGGDSGIGWMLVRTSAATPRIDVPEPGSLALVALALGGVVLVRRRTRLSA